MDSDFSRRSLMKGICSSALLSSVLPVAMESKAQAQARPASGMGPMPQEGPNTLRLGAPLGGRSITDQSMREVKQLGVDHVLMGGPKIPWDEAQLRAIVDKCKSGGLAVWNMMIDGFPNTRYGRPGRDQEIEQVKASIRAAGKAGIPVVEYNFYAHRAIEGYYEVDGRGGAGLTGFDAARVKNLPPLPQEGTHSLEEMWKNITYFLKAVVPVAEQSGVRLALHPNDPPVANSRGSGQIMGTVEGWKHLISIVDSPSNGITFDCGVTREMGHDPVEVCRYFGSRDRINHVHYRNPKVEEPYNKYVEGFIDTGDVNMLAVMRELVRVKYRHMVYPEHERALDYDRAVGIHNQYPGGGGYTGMVFDIAYARAMFQAAMMLEKQQAQASGAL
ncbi:MAG TPA: mannonate dehydratase [Acidobacteriaceae bacterium]|nr:mannonate dehydratase [Acidobacteriaceae bacterium]